MVMYRGRIVETGGRGDITTAPLHPYTRELLDAVPGVDAGARARLLRRIAYPRPAASDAVPDTGCAFANRCPHVLARCRVERPPLLPAAGARLVACHRATEWPGGLPPLVAA
jgi:oligopeptide/dipeptide ABC transporter ATP-binding protein